MVRKPNWDNDPIRRLRRNLQEVPPVLIGGINDPHKPMKDNLMNRLLFKQFCTLVRNFSFTAFRKMESRLLERDKKSKVFLAFRHFWVTLKVIQDLYPEVKTLCYLLLRNCYNPQYCKDYKDTLDFASEFAGSIQQMPWTGNEETDQNTYDILMVLRKLDKELWVPASALPRFEFESKEKFKYSFVQYELTDEQKEFFRNSVRTYISGLPKDKIFVPPPDVLLKVASSRYNDGGVVRRDYERPQNTLSGGFLYQKFCPKPYEVREVWLPDKSTKIINAFWMFIGRQILKSDTRYPDSDPMVTWERIKGRLKSFLHFDITAFGLQYLREYILIVAEVITSFYPSNDMEEYLILLRRSFENVKVTKDGMTYHPPRGIGLGYYEDLKTIGMMALLLPYDPISVYGDQGLLPYDGEKLATKKLIEYHFIIEKPVSKKVAGMKWSGLTMRLNSQPKRARSRLFSIVAALNGQYHWERKMILRSFYEEHPEEYSKITGRLSYLYERIFGYEFYPGDSLNNFNNSGICSISPTNSGMIRSVLVDRLLSPKDVIQDNMFYSTPFFTTWKRADSKKFSIRRKQLYKNSPIMDTVQYEYYNPVIEYHKTKQMDLSPLARLVDDSLETKLIVNYKLSTGRYTAGLTPSMMDTALRLYSRAPNPYQCLGTGGYRIKTPWHGVGVPCVDTMYLHDLLRNRVDLYDVYSVEKFDTRFPSKQLFSNPNSRKRKGTETPEEGMRVNSQNGNPLKRVLLSDMIGQTSFSLPKEKAVESPHQVTDLIKDIESRLIEFDSDAESGEDFDIYI
jgi:hypothetical protein